MIVHYFDLTPNPLTQDEGLLSEYCIILGFMKAVERDMFFGAKAEVFDLALRMRRNPTCAEKVMWEILRKFRKSGYSFRRQHPIEFYIADFYCHKLRLVIEVDGEVHSDKDVQIHDDGRTGEMERLGIKVIRFTNEEILNNSDSVIDQVRIIIGHHREN